MSFPFFTIESSKSKVLIIFTEIILNILLTNLHYFAFYAKNNSALVFCCLQIITFYRGVDYKQSIINFLSEIVLFRLFEKRERKKIGEANIIFFLLSRASTSYVQTDISIFETLYPPATKLFFLKANGDPIRKISLSSGVLATKFNFVIRN